MKTSVQRLFTTKNALIVEVKQRTEELHKINNAIEGIQGNCKHEHLLVVDEYMDYLYADPRYHIAVKCDDCGKVVTRQNRSDLVFGKRISDIKRLKK